MKSSFVLMLAAAALVGCNGGVNTVGQTPDEAGQQIADQICAKVASCGSPQIDCMGSASGSTCTGQIQPVTESECLDGAPAAYSQVVSQADSHGVARADLDACINAMLGESCITQAELDAYLAQLNAGMMDAVLRALPPQCTALGVTIGG